MSILVTGASGFIGGAVADTLLSDGYEVVLSVRKTLANKEGATQIDLDLSTGINPEVFERLRPLGVKTIVHCAAITPWLKNADYMLDQSMAHSVVALTKELGVERVIHISGWNVYDMSHSEPPYGEATSLNPDTPYGKSKRDVEEILQSELGDKVTSLRFASVYGPGQQSPGLITGLVGNAMRGEPLLVNAKLTRRDYMYIDDAVDAVVTLIDLPGQLPRAINIGSGSSVTVEDVAIKVAKACKELLQKDVMVSVAEELQESAVSDNCLSIELAESLGLTMLNKTSMERGLVAYIEWKMNEHIL